MMHGSKNYISTTELMHKLAISRSTLSALQREGLKPTVVVNSRTYRWDEAEVLKFLSNKNKNMQDK